MACYSPLKAFQIYYDKRTHKPHYKVTDYKVKYLEVSPNGTIIKHYEADNYVNTHKGKDGIKIFSNFIEIPCGKCLGCRLDHARMWADRCMLEMQYHESSYFLTLTYDDEHLPLVEYCDLDTGEVQTAPTLVKADYQNFLKALRQAYGKKYDNKLRFFLCGEYGSVSLRPHYHIIVFGLKLDDLTFYNRTSRGDILYNSDFLSGIWKKGHVVVGALTYESAGYTARYVMKKANYELSEKFVSCNMLPEFAAMSNKPGIGKQYFDDHPDLFDYDFIHVATDEGGIKFKPPRYFQKLKEEQDKTFVKRKKGKNLEFAKSSKIAKSDLTDLEYLDILNVEENVKCSQVEILKRRCPDG